ncbi:hypothetical protein LOK49_LG02G01043 [Camellia lanceoleosa]|uniref:Uncharacterized protein n=1 Tax=Camellia lanceoleosa TaxID=1840588 RepID=A0ACC0IP56_9ERIC|nr:hypothetical protein LOK49_LG02G01043 [Camellia lanceoleosa]
MLKFVQELLKVVTVGIVGGSDLVKISSSLGTQYKLYCSIFFKLSVLVFFVFLHSIFQKFFRSNIVSDCLTFYSMFAICAIINDYDYAFAENGLVAYKDGKLIGSQSLRSYLGEEKLKGFINFTLHYIADLDIPIKSDCSLSPCNQSWGNIALGKLMFRMFIVSQFHGGQHISRLVLDCC